MVEIERKFLVTSTVFKEQALDSFRIAQGFLSRDPDRTVRVRIKKDMGYLTIKGRSTEDGLKRFEWEQEISKKEALQLLKLCLPGTIDKIRYEVNVDGKLFEIDEFFGDNQGLVIAELELQHETETYKIPDWLGVEVTGEHKYYNSQLSLEPFNTWSKT